MGKVFWMLTCSQLVRCLCKSGLWILWNHLLTSPLNRQLGQGGEIGRPPSFCRQISELDRDPWPRVMMRAPNKSRNYLPRTLPKILPAACPQTTNLSPSCERRHSLPCRDHTLTSLVISVEDLILNEIQSKVTFGEWLSAPWHNHRNKLYFTLSLFLPFHREWHIFINTFSPKHPVWKIHFDHNSKLSHCLCETMPR